MSVDPTEARRRAQAWLGPEFDDPSKAEIARLLESHDSASEKELIDRFYRDLEFGTGGMRGVRGAGDNRINRYTIAKATQALADAIIEHGEPDRGVALAYDTRIGSIEFSLEAARVLCANDIRVYRFDDYCPVPILSFAVRRLGCQAGVVITASHNPPEYNGYKVYWEDGAQVVPPNDERIIGHYNRREGYGGVRSIPEKALRSHPRYEEVGDDLFRAYRETVLKMRLPTESAKEPDANISIVYTPLHGAGGRPVTELLAEAGFDDVEVVPTQAQPDGEFPTVASPNPEEPSAMALALETAQRSGADLVLGTDPDADRLGVYVRTANGDYFRPDGNQIGAILLETYCSRAKEAQRLPQPGALVNTIVSSDLHLAIAESYGLETFQTLTGFKFIGALMRSWELAGDARRLVLGTEESFGYLLGDYARDKDGVAAALWMAEATRACKRRSLTLDTVLGEIWKRHGCHRESSHSITMKGADGAEKIRGMMDRFRAQPPSRLAGADLLTVEDYQSSEIRNADRSAAGTIDLPSSNVLKWRFGDGSTVAVRPSGTEPKIKFYFAVKAPVADDPSTDLALLSREADTRLEEIKQETIALVT